MKIKLEVEGADREEMERYHEVMLALVSSGGLTGVKGGQTIIHFDNEGNFQGVQLSYWPYRKRRV